ncbi:DNA-directed RNA polymerase III subunit RPC5-like [Babylonia areolata]|uniref:DNA-directed RNA polymerase III subunit RPC5-like n=1 Tax=Babylonia areolata TaxID=304850 RepID=UPI003FD0DCCF
MEQDDTMDDPVVHEIDVYLSRSLASNLYVLQYPLRPGTMPLCDLEHTCARVKPKQKLVELGLALDTRSPNYCRSRGEQFAVNAGGGNNSEEERRYFRSGMLDTQILRSRPSLINTDRCAVGLLKDDELHLTPVHALAQMFPTFDYLDMADAKTKADAAAREGAGGDSSQEEEEEAEAVTIKFAPQETAEAKARRMASCEYIQKQVQEEQWSSLAYYNDAGDVEQEFQLLYAAHGGEKQQQFFSTAKQYLDAMLPKADNDEVMKPEMPDSVLTLQQLKQMPLADSVRALLTSVKVMQFSKLMEMLPEGTDPVSTLRALQQVAVMVQGCWVVKSEVLYPPDTCSPHSGVPAEHLIRGRDFVMWKFTHCKYVVRREIAAGLPSEDVKDILEQMSVLRSSKGWEFVYNYDREFVEKHPEVVQRQRLLWDSKYQTLCTYFKLPKEADKKAREAEQILMMQNVDRPRRRRASSRSSPRKRTLSGRSMSDMSDWDMDSDSMDRRHSHDRMNHTTDGATSISVEPMEVCGEDVKQTSLSNGSLHMADGAGDRSHSTAAVATVGGGGGGECSPQLRKELVELARDVMVKIPVLKFSILKQHYLMKRDLVPRDHALLSGIVSDRMLKEAVLEAGGAQVNKPVISQPDSDSLFVYVRQGNRMDRAREVLFSMLEFTSKVRSNLFISKVRELGDEDYSDAELKKLIRELCESHSGMWYLKGLAPKS